jgi:hypothetical protein
MAWRALRRASFAAVNFSFFRFLATAPRSISLRAVPSAKAAIPTGYKEAR